jgi:hypothetical protein
LVAAVFSFAFEDGMACNGDWQLKMFHRSFCCRASLACFGVALRSPRRATPALFALKILGIGDVWSAWPSGTDE